MCSPMKAKEYLHQLRRLDAAIDQKSRELSDLRRALGSLGGIDYSKDKVQTPFSGEAPFVRVIERIIDLEEELNADIDNFLNKKHEIVKQIQGLDNVLYAEILFKRYIEYKPLDLISAETNYTYQYIRELHGRALQEFERTYTNLHSTVV